MEAAEEGKGKRTERKRGCFGNRKECEGLRALTFVLDDNTTTRLRDVQKSAASEILRYYEPPPSSSSQIAQVLHQISARLNE